MSESLKSGHAADRAKLPAVLRELPWKLMADHELDEWFDGEVLLVAVPVNNHDKKSWFYEISVIRIECDEDYFTVSLHGESWGWTFSDIEWFVPLDPRWEATHD